VFYGIFGEGYYLKFYLSFTSILLVLSTFLLIKEILDRKGALVGTLLVMTFPGVSNVVTTPLTDTLFLIIVNLALTAYLKHIKSQQPYLLITSGVLVGLSFLTRATGLFLFVLITAHIGYMLYTKKMPLNRHISLFSMAFLLVILPWEIREITMGVGSGMTSRFDMLKYTSQVSFSLKDNINPDIDISMELPFQFGNLIRFIVLALLFIMPPALLMASWEIKKFRTDNSMDVLLSLWIASFVLPHILLTPAFSNRYLVPVIPALGVLLGRFVSFDMRGSPRWKSYVKTTLIISHIVLAAGVSYWYFDYRISRTDTMVFHDSGKWIKENTRDNETFLVYGYNTLSQFSYYSERKASNVDNPDYIIISDHRDPGEIEIKEDYVLCKEFSDIYTVRIYGKRCP
jgi:4-amino-4-deoxy-L-arabinose transferase-like glycosyltransferase